jgi:hypothetical protein
MKCGKLPVNHRNNVWKTMFKPNMRGKLGKHASTLHGKRAERLRRNEHMNAHRCSFWE